MKISVFTPVHKNEPEFLDQLFESLAGQTRRPDEWIIVFNGDAITMSFARPEHWVKIFRTDITGSIGALKGYCCSVATGDILVEIDYDDQLPTSEAIEKIETAFQDPNVQFAYSNCVELRDDGTCNVYGAQYGWKTRQVGPWGDQAQELTSIVAFPPQAHYMRRIEWAPNHVRAFRKSAYLKMRGYDATIAVGDDHDLICRFYIMFGEHGFHHIDECLYLYRVHGGNTCNASNRNAEIQRQVDVNYCRYAEKMYLRWAHDNNLDTYDLGGRFGCPPGYQSVDIIDADVIADLSATWPFKNNSVGVLRAYHVLEHLDDTIHFFNEAHRVLAPGGFLLIEVPSVNGAGAFGDPTHRRYFNLLSFEYFTDRRYAQYIQPQYTGRFQKARVVEYLWDNPRIPVISAQLIALKGWYDERWCGEKTI